MAHKINDLLTLLNFLFWYEQESPGVMWGGVRIGDAIESCRILLGYDEDTFEKLEMVVLGELTLEDVLTTKIPTNQTSQEPPQTPESGGS